MSDSSDNGGFILGVLFSHPDLAAATVGLLLSWAATQWIKKVVIPEEWPEPKYRRAVQITSFACGWLFTLGAWHLFDPEATRLERWYYAAGIGFASPAIYSLVVPWLGSKYPNMAKAMSGRPHDNS